MLQPEQLARLNIDRQLTASGWLVQGMKALNPSAGLGVAVREFPTDNGEADYILFVNGQPCGVIEAKEEKKGENLLTVEEQSGKYATSKLKRQKEGKVLKEIETRFSVADKMEKVIEQTLQQAETLRQSILKCAFEGKLI